ncbi:MAG: protein kinase [Vicinamibacteria bacterium]
MPLTAGEKLGSYEILSPIGAGGMGEVYRARDTKLAREVAIKVLPEAFAQNEQRLARFEREARLLASLNHPNIATLYGFEQSNGVQFLVMELADGETLAERLRRGPISVEDALPIFKQIAEALEAAHEKGIIHRDLKPANIKVSSEDKVKVLDFGLAKAISGDPVKSEVSESPTITRDATATGVILGTAAYMSPEQARGKPVDKRADIWALGCVLYECLAGRRPFQGESTTDVLAQIVSQQPDFDSLPRTTPDFLTRLLRRCLEKDPKRRLRDAGELRIAIEEFQSNPDSDIVRTLPGSQKVALSFRSVLPWALVVLLGGWLAHVLVGSADRSDVPTATVSSWSIALPARSRIALPTPGGGFNSSRMVAISPDGSRIAFSVQDEQDHAQLYLKAGSPLPRPIPGTMNGRGPFFSPAGEWLGFYDDDDNSIYKVALAGGSPQKLCDIGKSISFDAAWAPDGKSIVFATDDGLWQVSADGGPVEQLTKPDVQQGEVGHHSPRFTADGRGVFFTVSITPETHLALLSLDTGSWETIIPNGSLAFR